MHISGSRSISLHQEVGESRSPVLENRAAIAARKAPIRTVTAPQTRLDPSGVEAWVLTIRRRSAEGYE